MRTWCLKFKNLFSRYGTITEEEAEECKEDGCHRVGSAIVHQKGCKHLNWRKIITVTRPVRFIDSPNDYTDTFKKYGNLYPDSTLYVNYGNVADETVEINLVSKVKPPLRERLQNISEYDIERFVRKYKIPVITILMYMVAGVVLLALYFPKIFLWMVFNIGVYIVCRKFIK